MVQESNPHLMDILYPSNKLITNKKMNQTINLNEWKTKKQIMKQMRISTSLYKIRLNELKSSIEYSGLTKTLKIVNNPFSTKKTTKRITHESVVERFFSKRRVKPSEKDKLKKWSLRQKWDFFCHIVPPAIKENELIEKSQFFSKRIKDLYGKKAKVFFCIEDNPNDLDKGWVHAHILVRSKKLTIEKLKKEIELIFTYNFERRIQVERYDREKWGDRGVRYCHKDEKVRVFKGLAA
jgi:hypothetical protein